jgi:hypothetical protein
MIARLLGICIMGTLLAIAAYFLVPLLKVDTSNWPSVEGQIVDRRATRQKSQSHQYAITATYEYHVQGRRYASQRNSLAISPVQYVRAISPAEALNKAGFPVGQKVRVFHDPRDPARAVLDTRVSTSQRLLYLVLIGFCALGFLGAIFGKVRRVSIT